MVQPSRLHKMLGVPEAGGTPAPQSRFAFEACHVNGPGVLGVFLMRMLDSPGQCVYSEGTGLRADGSHGQTEETSVADRWTHAPHWRSGRATRPFHRNPVPKENAARIQNGVPGIPAEFRTLDR